MSYILDALKKMEHEKVKKARPGGMTSISGELFREERQRPSRGGAWRIVVVAIITACVAMAATWFYLKPVKSPAKNARRMSPAAVPAQPGPAPAVPAPPAPVQTPVQPPLALPAQQSAQPPLPAGTLPPTVAAPVPAAQTTPRKAVSSRKERSKQPAPPEQRPAVATIAPPADIKVSGIAWQEERSARRAVVNGFLMKEGGLVAGTRITEILRDRVRFSASGGDFEVSMVASGIPGANK